MHARSSTGFIPHDFRRRPLVQHRQRWDEWRELYRKLQNDYLHRAQGNSVVGRLADAFAFITLAGQLAAEALEMPSLKHTPIDELWDVLTAEAADADRATLALQLAYNWACSHPQEFWPSQLVNDTTKHQPPHGWAGVWSSQQSDPPTWPFVGFIPNHLKDMLAQAGFSFDAVVSTWHDRQWLLVDGSDKAKRHHQVTIAGTKPRVIAVKREAFVAAGCIAGTHSNLAESP